MISDCTVPVINPNGPGEGVCCLLGRSCNVSKRFIFVNAEQKTVRAGDIREVYWQVSSETNEDCVGFPRQANMEFVKSDAHKSLGYLQQKTCDKQQWDCRKRVIRSRTGEISTNHFRDPRAWRRQQKGKDKTWGMWSRLNIVLEPEDEIFG